MMARRTSLPLLAALCCSSAGAFALEEPAPDKNQFNLFRPTPPEFMRDLAADRPDKTESAYTVDAGHFQIEADLVTFSLDRHNGDPTDTRTRTWVVANNNYKIGLLNNVDLQLVVPTYTHVRFEDRDAKIVEKISGFGDVSLRTKVNLWGNDSGKTALSLMPFLKFPSAQNNLGNGAYEGGVIFPFAASLPCEWQMGLQTQFEFREDGSGTGYHTEFINTATVSHAIVGELGGYIEFFSNRSTERGSDWIATFDFGFTYGVTKNLQLDAGVNIGVTRAADDFNPFLGLTWRY
jgi:hypothetical protein